MNEQQTEVLTVLRKHKAGLMFSQLSLFTQIEDKQLTPLLEEMIFLGLIYQTVTEGPLHIKIYKIK